MKDSVLLGDWVCVTSLGERGVNSLRLELREGLWRVFRAKGVSEIWLGDISEHVVTLTLVLNCIGIGRKRTQSWVWDELMMLMRFYLYLSWPFLSLTTNQLHFTAV